MTLIAESESPAATSLAPVLRQVVQEIDRDMAVFDARSMQDIHINRAVKTPTVIAEIVSTLGGMGLTLAVVGLGAQRLGATSPSCLLPKVARSFRLTSTLIHVHGPGKDVCQCG